MHHIMAVSAHCMFNRKLIDFVTDLKPVLGHMQEYTLALSSVKMLDVIDERKNQVIFDLYIATPYHERIDACDDNFFLNHDDPNTVGVMQLLKTVWANMSQLDKDAVWAHLRVLLVLNRRCKST
jgi:hypothetical protein